jgi:mediator of RNA polymerase II transcription subunit 31
LKYNISGSITLDWTGRVEENGFNLTMAGVRPETEDQQKLRFQIELEFVQCLANPNYLNFLAQRGYFKDPAFINYLKYLEYWKEPDYAKFIKYPMALYFLDLLQHPEFRKELANGRCAKFVEDQQLLHWQHYIRKRAKLVQAAMPSDPLTQTGTGTSSQQNSQSQQQHPQTTSPSK